MLGLGDGANETHPAPLWPSGAGWMALKGWIGQLPNRPLHDAGGYMPGGSAQHAPIYLSFCKIFRAMMKLEAKFKGKLEASGVRRTSAGSKKRRLWRLEGTKGGCCLS